MTQPLADRAAAWFALAEAATPGKAVTFSNDLGSGVTIGPSDVCWTRSKDLRDTRRPKEQDEANAAFYAAAHNVGVDLLREALARIEELEKGLRACQFATGHVPKL